MGSMRALILPSFEDPPNVGEVPVPDMADDQVLVRVHASSINAFDAMIAAGMLKGMMEHRFPVTIGTDVSGVVESVGSAVTRFAPGDEVFGAVPTGSELHDGAFAEFAVLAEDRNIAPKPGAVGFLEAASLQVAGSTALAAIDTIDPPDADPVLIIGATGGVGSFAVQLAARRGATVIATGLPGDEGYLRDLGASEVVDYTADVAAAVRARYPGGVRGLVDAVNSSDGFADLTELLSGDGVAASIRGAADPERVRTPGAKAVNVNGSDDPALLELLADLVATGKIRVPLNRTYPLEEAAHALEVFRKDHTLGKFGIVVVSD
jgi:NADPH:quinone reductase